MSFAAMHDKYLDYGLDDPDWDHFLDWFEDRKGDYTDQFVDEHHGLWVDWYSEQYQSIEPIQPSTDDVAWCKRADEWALKNENTLIPLFIERYEQRFREWVYKSFWCADNVD